MRLRHCFGIILTISIAAGYLHLMERTIGTIATADGDSFVVTQYWNGGLDGFITDLVHTDLHGRVTTHTLDADDDRYRFVQLSMDEKNRLITVKLSGNRSKSVSF